MVRHPGVGVGDRLLGARPDAGESLLSSTSPLRVGDGSMTIPVAGVFWAEFEPLATPERRKGRMIPEDPPSARDGRSASPHLSSTVVWSGMSRMKPSERRPSPEIPIITRHSVVRLDA